MNALLWIGRILFSLLFIGSGLGHFMQMESTSRYAASKGLPAPKLAVAVSGLMIILGGLSILFWQYVIWGSWLLILFLLVAAFTVHDFWKQEDPMAKQNEMAQFMKNLSLAGAALIFYVLAQRPELFG